MSKGKNRRNKNKDFERRGFREPSNRNRLLTQILNNRYVLENTGLSDNVYSDNRVSVIYPHRKQVTYLHRNVNQTVSGSKANRRTQSPLLGAPSLFAESYRAMVCRARQVRKEVLHATRKTGKGVDRKPPRFTELSKIKC